MLQTLGAHHCSTTALDAESLSFIAALPRVLSARCDANVNVLDPKQKAPAEAGAQSQQTLRLKALLRKDRKVLRLVADIFSLREYTQLPRPGKRQRFAHTQ